jgi:hypothetical protein
MKPFIKFTMSPNEVVRGLEKISLCLHQVIIGKRSQSLIPLGAFNTLLLRNIMLLLEKLIFILIWVGRNPL